MTPSFPDADGGAPAVRILVKLGGRVQQDPALPAAIADLCRAHPGGVCIVHGGGDEISTLQRALGSEPAFVGGRRVTRAEDLDLVRMALSGASNKRLVSALGAAGVAAVGVSGEDGGMFLAERGDPALGCVGRVTRVEPTLVGLLLRAGYLPVVSPLARELGTGGALNVNGDDAAAALAIALGAGEVLFMADVPGVLEDEAVIPALDPEGAHALVARGVAAGGMAAKLDAALAALAGGVPRARIGGLDALRDAARGTQITMARAHAA
ncbi:MAG TPA: acetylglutamate kinase [Gemmatimonadales bacterium]